MYCAIVNDAPIRNSPRCPSANCDKAAIAAVSNLSILPAYFRSMVPAGVSEMRAPLRSNSCTPRCCSKALICRVTAGCVRQSSSAALRKFKCLATARKTLSRKFSISVFLLGWQRIAYRASEAGCLPRLRRSKPLSNNHAIDDYKAFRDLTLFCSWLREERSARPDLKLPLPVVQHTHPNLAFRKISGPSTSSGLRARNASAYCTPTRLPT